MSNPSAPVTVAVPVTLYVTVSFADATPVNPQAAAEAVAACAAEHFAHVSHAEIAAFNEVNRVHPQAVGTVSAVTTSLDEPQKAAA